ncbi:unnamed protein product [Microthlaspi erraticum]|uniref:Uncharacterized protein n=1 Tax=Microthlaspi erraticum TaxID=1685480 RepID=A0A6D2K8B2_9BRAS|nr:unnamed protein product [Microthlaspi erraticum]
MPMGASPSQLYANSLDFPMRQHMTSRRTQRGNKLPLLIGHTLPMNHSCLQVKDIPSLRSGVVTFQPKEEDFYVPSSEKPSFPILTYRTLQRTVKAQRRHQERHVLTLAWRAPSSRPCEQAGEDVECQSRFISRLVRVVRHIAPERLFRPSSTAREPYEPDLGEFSLDSELGSEGDDPIDEEESSSHCHT